jgi:uncharacterized protein (UPF0548 family)
VTFTYPEVGATRTDELPPGYRHVRRRVEVSALTPVATGMRAWGIHRGAGLAVHAGGEPAVGMAFRSGVGIGRLRLWVPCQVVWVRDEPDAYGYGFGTLPGHPERGEEAFFVSRDAEGRVWFEIRAFSRPATRYARLGGPVTRAFQDWVTDRYVSAARSMR